MSRSDGVTTYHIASPLVPTEVSSSHQSKDAANISTMESNQLGATPKARASTTDTSTPWTDRLRFDMGLPPTPPPPAIVTSKQQTKHTYTKVFIVLPHIADDRERKAEEAMQEALAKGLSLAEAAKIRRDILPRKQAAARQGKAARWTLGSGREVI